MQARHYLPQHFRNSSREDVLLRLRPTTINLRNDAECQCQKCSRAVVSSQCDWKLLLLGLLFWQLWVFSVQEVRRFKLKEKKTVTISVQKYFSCDGRLNWESNSWRVEPRLRSRLATSTSDCWNEATFIVQGLQGQSHIPKLPISVVTALSCNVWVWPHDFCIISLLSVYHLSCTLASSIVCAPLLSYNYVLHWGCAFLSSAATQELCSARDS